MKSFYFVILVQEVSKESQELMRKALEEVSYLTTHSTDASGWV